MHGPKRRYRPQFEAEEIAEAQRIARQRNAPSSQVQRAKMVLILVDQPNISHEALAGEVGIHPTTAKKWRKRWAESGFTLLDRPRSGRPPVFSPRSRG